MQKQPEAPKADYILKLLDQDPQSTAKSGISSLKTNESGAHLGITYGKTRNLNLKYILVEEVTNASRVQKQEEFAVKLRKAKT